MLPFYSNNLIHATQAEIYCRKQTVRIYSHCLLHKSSQRIHSVFIIRSVDFFPQVLVLIADIMNSCLSIIV